MIVKGKRPWYRVLLSPFAVFVAPALILYSVFFVYPSLQAFYVSLNEWRGFAPKMEFVGLANFHELLYESKFLYAILNNFIIMFGGGIVVFFFALLFASALSNRSFPGRRFFRTMLFAPQMIAMVAVAILWKFIYDSELGFLNPLLSYIATAFVKVGHLLGITEATSHTVNVVWLGSWETAMPSIIILMTWGGVGFYLVLLMAGIDRIPDQLYEAARIDGATEVQNFFYITLPLLRDVLTVAISLWIIGALKTFGLIWVLTEGIHDTHVMATYMYQVAFDARLNSFRMGYGTAMAVVLFGFVILITFAFNAIARRTKLEY